MTRPHGWRESVGLLTSERRRARVGGDDSCAHPRERLTYLGQTSATGFFQCAVCDGVVIEW